MNRPIIRNSMSEGELYKLVYSMDGYISELEDKSLEDLDTINDLANQVHDLRFELDTLKLKLEKYQELCSFKYSVLLEKALDNACETLEKKDDFVRFIVQRFTGNGYKIKSKDKWKKEIMKEVQDE